MIGRNFDLASRKENTREKISKQVVRFGLEEILEHFSESMKCIDEQLNLLGIPLNNVADYAFYEQGSTEKPKDKLKRRLGDLFYRRNLIVHQVDKEHTDASQKEIRKETVVDFKDDIEKIVHGIHKATKEKVKAEQETEEND